MLLPSLAGFLDIKLFYHVLCIISPMLLVDYTAFCIRILSEYASFDPNQKFDLIGNIYNLLSFVVHMNAHTYLLSMVHT